LETLEDLDALDAEKEDLELQVGEYYRLHYPVTEYRLNVTEYRPYVTEYRRRDGGFRVSAQISHRFSTNQPQNNHNLTLYQTQMKHANEMTVLLIRVREAEETAATEIAKRESLQVTPNEAPMKPPISPNSPRIHPLAVDNHCEPG